MNSNAACQNTAIMRHTLTLITALLLASATVANGQSLEIADLETRMLARLRVSLLTDIPDGKRRHRLPQGVVRRKHPVIPMPVPPGRWDQRCQPVEKLKRRQLDDTTGPGPRRLSRASRANPVPALVPRQGVANPLRSVARVRHNRKPLNCKRRPGAVTQQMLEAPEVPRHVPVSKRESNAGID